MAASRRMMDRGYHNLSKTISFRLFFWLAFPQNGRIDLLQEAYYLLVLTLLS